MAKSKVELFSSQEVALAAFAKSMAHPARVAIVAHLREHSEANCGQIVDALPLAQPTVSQHLKALSAAGMLRSRERGPMILYSLNYEALGQFCSALHRSLCTGECDYLRKMEESCATASSGVSNEEVGSVVAASAGVGTDGNGNRELAAAQA